MHDHEKSDSAILAMNPANAEAESAERRAETKRKTRDTAQAEYPSRKIVSPGFDRLRMRGKDHQDEPFTTLLHHINTETLSQAYYLLNRNASVGVDGVAWKTYGENLQENIADLLTRVHRGGPYHPQPSRRVLIPKPDGKQRPLGIASLEDKIVQRVVVEILDAIYEPMFLCFSYGFRPGKSQHDALDSLWVGIHNKRVNWIVDADLRSFFDTVGHERLIAMLEQRIQDKRVIRLINKWLKAGVLENGLVRASEIGTPQGAVISPMLSNIFLHYALDLWVHEWRQAAGRGDVIMVRYADDFVCGFEHEADAQAFLAELTSRMKEYGLELHDKKTRLIEFGRFAIERRMKRGMRKPETFTFLGFTHISAKDHNGKFQLLRKSRRDRLRAKRKQVKNKLRARINESVSVQGKWLGSVLRGYFAYHAIPCNISSLYDIRNGVVHDWLRLLRRQSQRTNWTWARMMRLANEWLPMPRITHPWPRYRFAVKHSR